LKFKIFKKDIWVTFSKKFIWPTIFFINLKTKDERFVVGINKVTCFECFGVRIEIIEPCTEIKPIVKREPRKIVEKN
jgi:hypothetical protein